MTDDEPEGDETEDGEELELAFSEGDIVQLKSGGPPMTVDELPHTDQWGGYKHYHCVWFKGATKEHDYFAEHLLKTYIPPEKK